jgi:membrane-bound serine protease (ClpP class)
MKKRVREPSFARASKKGSRTLFWLAFLIVALASLRGALAVTPQPVVYSAEVDSIIHPASAEYMIQTMNRADADHAVLLVFTLRTPGGLVDSTREIITHMLAAKTPIAIWVGPSGTRAASAGFILTVAADVAAMAPGTQHRRGAPVNGGGQAMDETMAKKAAEDVAAYVRLLARPASRNVELAEQAVNQSKAFSEEEALKATPPLIDLSPPTFPICSRSWMAAPSRGSTAARWCSTRRRPQSSPWR